MKFSREELRAVISVSSILAIRLLGIFLILPVFSVYTVNYPGATVASAGVAFGIYALTQSLLQIPFGWASDKIGRKPMILIGLGLFTIGSIVCGLSNSIDQLIFARAIQGGGAVGAVAIASLGDLSRPSMRTQVFSITGIAIGMAFLIAIISGPILAAEFGFKNLFFILAGLGVIAMLATIFLFPSIKTNNKRQRLKEILNLLTDIELRRLYISGLVVSLTVNLFVFIYQLTWTASGVTKQELWKVYIIVLIPSALLVFPYVRHSERKGSMGLPTKTAWVLTLVSFVLYIWTDDSKFLLYTVGITFFLGHTLFQSLIPAFLTQRVPQENRGTSTGFYSLSSFLGASIGGMLAGYLYHLNPIYPVICALVFVILWLLTGLPTPPNTDSMS